MMRMSRSMWIATALLVVSLYVCLSLRQRGYLEVRFETVRRKNSVATVSVNNKGTATTSTSASAREKTWLHSSDHQLLSPLRVLQDYKTKHSADVLSKESFQQLIERRYVVTGYSCPYRMGNIWHSYFNTIVWAIITNRTIVVRYDTHAKKAPQHDCEKVAMQAPWLPEFQTVQQRLVPGNFDLESPNVTVSLTSDQVQDLADLFVGPSLFHTYQRENGKELIDDETSSRLQRALKDLNSHQAVVFPLIGSIHLNEQLSNVFHIGGWSTGSPYTMRKHFDYNDLLFDDGLKSDAVNEATLSSLFSSSPQHQLLSPNDFELLQLGRSSACDLFQQGFHFLFGMIFRECFDILVTPKPSTPVRKQDAYTVALHSRHVVFEDDGTIVDDEVVCLQKFLEQIEMWETSNRTIHAKDCQVILMSDRQKTIDKISEWLLHHTNCTPVVHVHDDRERKDRDGVKEHGDFAGSGFVAELEVAVQARTGVIGNLRDAEFRGGRSSTAFLMELIEYDRRTEANDRGMDVASLPDLFQCQLPGKGVNGYTIGSVSFKKNESTAFWGKGGS